LAKKNCPTGTKFPEKRKLDSGSFATSAKRSNLAHPKIWGCRGSRRVQSTCPYGRTRDVVRTVELFELCLLMCPRKSTVRTTSRGLGAVLGRYCDAPDAALRLLSPKSYGALHRRGHRHASATTLRFISLSPRGWQLLHRSCSNRQQLSVELGTHLEVRCIVAPLERERGTEIERVCVQVCVGIVRCWVSGALECVCTDTHTHVSMEGGTWTDHRSRGSASLSVTKLIPGAGDWGNQI